ncbi:lycopene cyclase domain-containing protein [Solwaraspora sp. WMMD937]|uniref:lycopene cyclase domain-containing protein n=1 Tax=Solwaraspora sp. WMMD937 TaxID=3016090 RepID=UPI00249A1E7A|nr:lycopene cyclase domain-containing protein [Solwaraspora sp. WMMD937]WFE21121.1 lycopene cyclase domain-containing protein [Solwaraspora sp. WMMD937]
MSYTVAALLGVVAAVLVDLVVLRTRLVLRAVFWTTYPIIVGFQLLSNGILTGRAIVRYDPAVIVGLRIAYAPVEDLLFGFAMVLFTLSVWVWLGRRGVQRSPAAGEGDWLLARLRRRPGRRPGDTGRDEH